MGTAEALLLGGANVTSRLFARLIGEAPDFQTASGARVCGVARYSTCCQLAPPDVSYSTYARPGPNPDKCAEKHRPASGLPIGYPAPLDLTPRAKGTGLSIVDSAMQVI